MLKTEMRLENRRGSRGSSPAARGSLVVVHLDAARMLIGEVVAPRTGADVGYSVTVADRCGHLYRVSRDRCLLPTLAEQRKWERTRA